LLLGLTVLVSMCLSTVPAATKARSDASSEEVLSTDVADHSGAQSLGDPLYDPPVLPKERLTVMSRRIYAAWTVFCRLIPAWMVFGMPAVMMGLARPYPQEVFAALTLLTSAFLFANGIYMAIFAECARARFPLRPRMRLARRRSRRREECSTG